jgi:hypothetical protein
MKRMFSFILTMMILTTGMFAQQQQQVQTIKPSLPLSEIAFSLQLLESIQLMGSEVDALMELRMILVPPIVKANNDKKQANDVVTLEFKVQQAQNLLNFLKRAKLNGSDVERFKKFTDVIITSAQPKK